MSINKTLGYNNFKFYTKDSTSHFQVLISLIHNCDSFCDFEQKRHFQIDLFNNMDEFEFFELCSDIEGYYYDTRSGVIYKLSSETNRIPGVPTKSDLLRVREKREFLAFRNYEVSQFNASKLRKRYRYKCNSLASIHQHATYSKWEAHQFMECAIRDAFDAGNYELRKKTHFPLNASMKCLFMDAYCENDALLSIWNLNGKLFSHLGYPYAYSQHFLDILVSSELHFNDETIFYENACLCETALDGIKFFVAGRTDSSNNCSLFEAAFSRESTSQLLPLTRKAGINGCASVTAMEYNNYCKTLFICCGNYIAILASNGFIFKTMLRFRNFAETMAINKDGSCVYVGMSGFEVIRHDIREAFRKAVFRDVVSVRACSLKLCERDNSIIMLSFNGEMQEVDLRTGKTLITYERHCNRGFKLPLIMDPEERVILSTGADGIVRVWSKLTGELVQIIDVSSPITDKFSIPQIACTNIFKKRIRPAEVIVAREGGYRLYQLK
ncbi:DDB1- and CUL4-associated factor 4 [Trichinella sp. T8]|nr:DDB1- and CUL4-associated factor 4 [Trichinella sp. T8]